MNFCKTCSTTLNVTEEHELDGTPVYFCKTCRRYQQGLLAKSDAVDFGKRVVK